MTEQRVSSRYARALLDTALQVGIAESVFEDFKKVRASLDASREFKSITASPVFQLWRKKKIYKELFAEIKISDLTLNFLLLLIDKRRGVLISSIVEEYQKQFEILENRLQVEITSAIELTEEIKSKLIDKLSEWTHKTILSTYKIEPSIKGGLIVKIDDWVYDASIKNQLEILYTLLSEDRSQV